MRILIVSHLFKNPLEHSKLPSLFDLVQTISTEAEVEVVAPVPWSPPIRPSPRWSTFSRIPMEHRYGSVRVRYPRHLVFPRRFLYALSGPTFHRALRATVWAESYDVIWAHYAFPDGWAAVRLGRETQTPVIVTVRGEDVRSDVGHPGVRGRVREALLGADVVTSPHPETTQLAKALGRATVVELHNGIDVERFGRGDRRRIREELGLSHEFVATFVGHLVAFKDPATFVEAAALVPPEAGVVFVLVGSPGRGREQTDLRGLAKRLGVESRVRFLGDRGDVADILAASDAFLALSPAENIWSTAILEAMAAGVPCIVTNAGMTAAYLRDRVEAVLIPAKDPSAVSRAILELKADSDLRRRLADHGRKLVADGFELKSVARSAMAMCASLSSSRRATGPGMPPSGAPS